VVVSWAGEEEGLDLVDGVADERCTRCDIGHGQLTDRPRASGSFSVVVE